MAQSPTETSREVVSTMDMVITASWTDQETPVFVANTDGRHDPLEFRDFRSVELLFGLWMDCGPFQIEPDDAHRIPRQVAVAGQPQIAAYLGVVEPGNSGVDKHIRAEIAQSMNLSKQTVSNYWSQIRWDGCPDCLSDDTDNIVVDVGHDEVKLRVCNGCGCYFVNDEDIVQKPHTGEKHSDCTDELESVVGHNNGDEYRLDVCMPCGYYTSNGDIDAQSDGVPTREFTDQASGTTYSSDLSDLDIAFDSSEISEKQIPTTAKLRELMVQLDTDPEGIATDTVTAVATEELGIAPESVITGIETLKQRGDIYEVSEDQFKAT